MLRKIMMFLCIVAGSAAVPVRAQQTGAAAPVVQAVPAAASFVLRPGDLLRVGVWREPDLSGDFLVDEKGRVTLPLLGELRAAGIPFDEFRAALLERYAGELRNPSITIIPLRRVYVLGEVLRPGLYPVDPTVALAGVVALAGGANNQGDLRRIRIVRNGAVIQQVAAAEATLTATDVRSDDQIYVGRRSWFDRNSNFVISTVLSIPALMSVIITILDRV